MSNSLQSHGLQHTRLPCPSLSPWVCSNSCPLNRWCHPAISFSVFCFSSCPQSFPESGSFPSTLYLRWPKYWSFSFSISPSKEYSGLISLRLTGAISLQCKGPSRVFSCTIIQKHQFFQCWAFFMVQHPYMTTGKTVALTIWTFIGKVMSFLFNMLSRFVIAFFPRCKRLLISWLQLPSAVILEPKKRKYVTVSTFSPFICHEVIGPNAIILLFWMLSFKLAFSLSSRRRKWQPTPVLLPGNSHGWRSLVGCSPWGH